MANKPPWFKMDPSKFLQDRLIDAMSTEELGMAFRLLCRQWIDGDIPDDKNLLARLCRVNRAAMDSAWSVISAFFPVVADGRRANRFMWVEREVTVSAMIKKETDGRDAVNRRWNAIRDPKVTNRPPIADLIQDKDKERDKEEEKETPLAGGPGGDGVKPKTKRKPKWTTAHPMDVVQATGTIVGMWPSPSIGCYQPDGKSLVPGISPSELACRLADIKDQGADLGICAEIAQKAVQEWKSGKWIKAPQYFFGKADDAPFRAYYQAYVTNKQLQEVANG